MLKDLIGARKYVDVALKMEIHWILEIPSPSPTLDGGTLEEIKVDLSRSVP